MTAPDLAYLRYCALHPFSALASIGQSIDYCPCGCATLRYSRHAWIGDFFGRVLRPVFARATRRERSGWGGAAWTDPILSDPDELPF